MTSSLVVVVGKGGRKDSVPRRQRGPAQLADRRPTRAAWWFPDTRAWPGRSFPPWCVPAMPRSCWGCPGRWCTSWGDAGPRRVDHRAAMAAVPPRHGRSCFRRAAGNSSRRRGEGATPRRPACSTFRDGVPPEHPAGLGHGDRDLPAFQSRARSATRSVVQPPLSAPHSSAGQRGAPAARFGHPFSPPSLGHRPVAGSDRLRHRGADRAAVRPA